MRRLVVLLAIIAFVRPDAHCAPSIDRAAIIGSWWSHRSNVGDKVIVFHADGSWGVKRLPEQRDEIDGRRWWLEGRNLMLRYRIDTGFATSKYPIVSFTRDKFITDIDGYKWSYTRLPR